MRFFGWVMVWGLALLGSGAARAQGTEKTVVDGLYREGIRLYEEGRYLEGIEVGKVAVNRARSVLGEQHPDYATALMNLADHCQAMGRYTEAEPLYLEALAIYKKRLGAQHPSYATALNNLAALYEAVGHFALAESLYLESLAIRQQQLGLQHPDYAASLNNLALFYESLGRYAEAEPRYLEALAINKQHFGPQHPDYATLLDNISSFFQTLGRYAEAELRFLEALTIRQQQLGPQHPDYANSLNNLANLYETMGRYTEAEPLYLKSLVIRRQQLGPQHPDYASSLANLGALYQAMGCYAEAEPRYRESLAIRRQQLGCQHPDYANSLNNIAALYKAMGRYTEAEPRFLEALAVYEQQLGPQHPECASSLTNLANLYQMMGCYTEAETASARSTDIDLRHVRSTFAVLSEREKQQFLATVGNDAEIYHSILAQLAPSTPRPAGAARAYDHALFTKGLLLAATAGMQRQLLASPDTALRRRYGQWQTLKHQLATARTLPVAQQHERGLDPAQLDHQANTLEKELAAKSATFRKGTNLPTATWQQVQRALRPGEVAVELVRYRWYNRKLTDTVYYSAYLVTPTCQTPQLVVLKNGNDLEGRYLAAYRQLTHAAKLPSSLTTAKPAPRPSDSQSAQARGAVDANADADAALADAKVLYQAYWAPIAAALPAGTHTVYLSADGAYQQLNLNTLQNPQTGHYLLDELDLHLVGSTRELVPDPTATVAPQAGASVLVGAPAYRLEAAGLQAAIVSAPALPTRSAYSRSESLLPSGEVPPLPGTAREVAQLDALLVQAKSPHRTYTGPAATEEAIRDLHHPRVLHIATHGSFVPQTAAKPGTGRELTTAEVAAATDPMLRSGLLLAGVSNFRDAPEKPATEDGILTAYEASLLDLQGTELVVLSACETGLGQVQNGEGVYGLQRGFTVAGAKSILMSLWKVDDAVTQELMGAFYKSWLGGQSKRAALLAAQQKVRRQHPQPYYWGAFVLVGE